MYIHSFIHSAQFSACMQNVISMHFDILIVLTLCAVNYAFVALPLTLSKVTAWAECAGRVLDFLTFYGCLVILIITTSVCVQYVAHVAPHETVWHQLGPNTKN